MRRIVSALLILSLLFSLAGCSNVSESDSIETGTEREQQIEEEVQEPSGEESEQSAAETEGTLENGENDILVAYFSWADNAILADDVDALSSPSVIPPGNVQELAQWVQEETGGDLFSIRVTDPYSSDWDECLERANEERGSNARPELEENVENIEDYDVVFLGYPKMEQGFTCVYSV